MEMGTANSSPHACIFFCQKLLQWLKFFVSKLQKERLKRLYFIYNIKFVGPYQVVWKWKRDGQESVESIADIDCVCGISGISGIRICETFTF